MKKPFAFWVATWFGSGLLKDRLYIGGATWGSFFALPLCWLAVHFGRRLNDYLTVMNPNSMLVYSCWAVLLILILQIGLATIPITEEILGEVLNWRKKLVKHDQSQIVIDEVFGMVVTCTPLLWLNFHNWWIALALAFGLFRGFDMAKIWPTNVFDRMESAWGVMLDDGMAGIYAAACLIAIYQWVWQF